MMSIPDNMRSTFVSGSFPTRSESKDLSRVNSCDTFTTESLESPVNRRKSRTFPGASAHFTLLVRGTHTTVLILLRFIASPWTTITGRRKPGPEPVGSGSSAHQISPWQITTPCSPGHVWLPMIRTHLMLHRVFQSRCSSPRLPHPVRVLQGTHEVPR